MAYHRYRPDVVSRHHHEPGSPKQAGLAAPPTFDCSWLLSHTETSGWLGDFLPDSREAGTQSAAYPVE